MADGGVEPEGDGRGWLGGRRQLTGGILSAMLVTVDTACYAMLYMSVYICKIGSPTFMLPACGLIKMARIVSFAFSNALINSRDYRP